MVDVETYLEDALERALSYYVDGPLGEDEYFDVLADFKSPSAPAGMSVQEHLKQRFRYRDSLTGMRLDLGVASPGLSADTFTQPKDPSVLEQDLPIVGQIFRRAGYFAGRQIRRLMLLRDGRDRTGLTLLGGLELAQAQVTDAANRLHLRHRNVHVLTSLLGYHPSFGFRMLDQGLHLAQRDYVSDCFGAKVTFGLTMEGVRLKFDGRLYEIVDIDREAVRRSNLPDPKMPRPRKRPLPIGWSQVQQALLSVDGRDSVLLRNRDSGCTSKGKIEVMADGEILNSMRRLLAHVPAMTIPELIAKICLPQQGRANPDRVEQLVIEHTLAPNPNLPDVVATPEHLAAFEQAGRALRSASRGRMRQPLAEVMEKDSRILGLMHQDHRSSRARLHFLRCTEAQWDRLAFEAGGSNRASCEENAPEIVRLESGPICLNIDHGSPHMIADALSSSIASGRCVIVFGSSPPRGIPRELSNLGLFERYSRVAAKQLAGEPKAKREALPIPLPQARKDLVTFLEHEPPEAPEKAAVIPVEPATPQEQSRDIEPNVDVEPILTHGVDVDDEDGTASRVATEPTLSSSDARTGDGGDRRQPCDSGQREAPDTLPAADDPRSLECHESAPDNLDLARLPTIPTALNDGSQSLQREIGQLHLTIDEGNSELGSADIKTSRTRNNVRSKVVGDSQTATDREPTEKAPRQVEFALVEANGELNLVPPGTQMTLPGVAGNGRPYGYHRQRQTKPVQEKATQELPAQPQNAESPSAEAHVDPQLELSFSHDSSEQAPAAPTEDSPVTPMEKRDEARAKEPMPDDHGEQPGLLPDDVGMVETSTSGTQDSIPLAGVPPKDESPAILLQDATLMAANPADAVTDQEPNDAPDKVDGGDEVAQRLTEHVQRPGADLPGGPEEPDNPVGSEVMAAPTAGPSVGPAAFLDELGNNETEDQTSGTLEDQEALRARFNHCMEKLEEIANRQKGHEGQKHASRHGRDEKTPLEDHHSGVGGGADEDSAMCDALSEIVEEPKDLDVDAPAAALWRNEFIQRYGPTAAKHEVLLHDPGMDGIRASARLLLVDPSLAAEALREAADGLRDSDGNQVGQAITDDQALAPGGIGVGIDEEGYLYVERSFLDEWLMDPSKVEAASILLHDLFQLVEAFRNLPDDIVGRYRPPNVGLPSSPDID